MISGRAPLERFIIAITSAFLLVRSAFGFAAGFLPRPPFFAAWRVCVRPSAAQPRACRRSRNRLCSLSSPCRRTQFGRACARSTRSTVLQIALAISYRRFSDGVDGKMYRLTLWMGIRGNPRVPVEYSRITTSAPRGGLLKRPARAPSPGQRTNAFVFRCRLMTLTK